MNLLAQADGKFALHLPFWFSSSLSRLDDAHPHWWRQSSLFTLLIQIISTGNTFTDTPRNNVLLVIWASLIPVRLTHKINHHTHFLYFLWLYPWEVFLVCNLPWPYLNESLLSLETLYFHTWRAFILEEPRVNQRWLYSLINEKLFQIRFIDNSGNTISSKNNPSVSTQFNMSLITSEVLSEP